MVNIIQTQKRMHQAQSQKAI